MTRMNIKQLIKELSFGVAPVAAGTYLFDKTSAINILVSISLLTFGCIIIGIIIWNFLQREKVMRSHLGYGYLK